MCTVGFEHIYENIKGYDPTFNWQAESTEILTISTAIQLLFEWIKAGNGEMYGDEKQFRERVAKHWKGKNFNINRQVLFIYNEKQQSYHFRF